ncbi:MAG: Rieske (2Fe-2S) protein [Gemmatimonadota bacterium]|jgi:nitrite reductase/ring-hydroxylating ferredoxin subunit
MDNDKHDIHEVNAPNETIVHGSEPDACGSCALRATRRDFLRDGAIAAALMLGLWPRRGQATMIPRLLSGVLSGNGEIAYPIPKTDSVSIDHKEDIIVARSQGKLYAFYLSCPHQHTALHWIKKHDEFECPKHHSKYKPDGEFISGRATRGMDRYAVRIQGDQLMVNLNKLYRQDRDPDGWNNAYVSVPSEPAAVASG